MSDETTRDISLHNWILWRHLGTAVAVEPLDLAWDEGLDYPGIYVWGHFKEAPCGNDENPHLREEVVYIGRAKNIRKRPTPHHEKIDEYKFHTGDWRLVHLYVALFTVDNCFDCTGPDEKRLRGFEKRLVNENKSKFGRLPPLNKQGGG